MAPKKELKVSKAVLDYRASKLAEFEETAKAIKVYREELFEELPKIHEAEFRATWLYLFFGDPNPNLSLWINQVAGNGNTPVRIINEAGEVVCTMPPLFAPKGTTITRGTTKEAKLHQVLADQRARSAVLPTRKEEIFISAMLPYVDIVRKDETWAKEWVKLCNYFQIPMEKWLVKDDMENVLSETNQTTQLSKKVALSQIQEDDEVYGDFTEL